MLDHQSLLGLLKICEPSEKYKLIGGWGFGENNLPILDIMPPKLKSMAKSKGLRTKFGFLEHLSKFRKIDCSFLHHCAEIMLEKFIGHIDPFPIQLTSNQDTESTRNYELSKHDDILMAEVTYEENGGKFINFSSVNCSAPRNRLCRKFGSENFLIVKLNLPKFSTEDIIDIIDGGFDISVKEEEDKKEISMSREEMIARYKSLSEISAEQVEQTEKLLNAIIGFGDKEEDQVSCDHDETDEDEDAEEDKTKHEILMNMNLLQAIAHGSSFEKFPNNELFYKHMNIDIFKKPLTIFDEEFEFLCCNTTGALQQKYIFVNKKIKRDVLGWAFSVESEFNNTLTDSTPLRVPLRLSLLNSLCVPTVYLDINQYIEEPKGSDIDMRDGCGLIFSEEMIDDIISSYNKNVFNVGQESQSPLDFHSNFTNLGQSPNTISKDLSYDLPNNIKDGYKPCAFQIRYKGFKGMLVYHRDRTSFNIDESKDIYFTKSMKKFETPIIKDPQDIMNNLCIVGISQPYRPTILSSELLYLFTGLTNNRSNLLAYFEKYLIHSRIDTNSSLYEIFNSPDVASRLITQRGDSKILDRFKVADQIVENKSFYTSLILGSQAFHSYLLTLNAPMPKSAHLYGVADFTNTLQEGELFIQLTNNDNSKFILETDILITKTPALFRSDLRKFKAVKCEALLHLYDVVVFSTRGTKFEPSNISNADLDGDHFYIFWDKDLLDIIDINENKEPTINNKIPNSTHELSPQEISNILSNETISLDEPKNYIARVEESLKQSAKKLLSPINTFKHCTLNNLLELRRRFIDDFDNNWTTDEKYTIMYEIGQAITDTLDAPKHGNWRSWDSLKDILKGTIPQFPHYHTSINSKISTSIYGQLYEKLLFEILKSVTKNKDINEEMSIRCFNSQKQIEHLKIRHDYCSMDTITPFRTEVAKSFNFNTKEDIFRSSILLDWLFTFTLTCSFEEWKTKLEIPIDCESFATFGDFLNTIENDYDGDSVDYAAYGASTGLIVQNSLSDSNMWTKDGTFKYPQISKCCLIERLIRNKYYGAKKFKFNQEHKDMIEFVEGYLELKLKWIIDNKQIYPISSFQCDQIISDILWFKNTKQALENRKRRKIPKNMIVLYSSLNENLHFEISESITKPLVEDYFSIDNSDLLDILGWDWYVIPKSANRRPAISFFFEQTFTTYHNEITIEYDDFENKIYRKNLNQTGLVELCFEIKQCSDKKIESL